jgi:hypothetical protein
VISGKRLKNKQEQGKIGRKIIKKPGNIKKKLFKIAANFRLLVW